MLNLVFGLLIAFCSGGLEPLPMAAALTLQLNTGLAVFTKKEKIVIQSSASNFKAARLVVDLGIFNDAAPW